MAVSAATVSSDFNSGFLPPHIAAPIFDRAQRISVVQRLAQRIPLSDNGEAVPVVTGRLSAGWVDEGARKPASAGSLGLLSMIPKKIAAIAVVSAEVVRKNPGGYMDLLRPQMAEAFALGFDQASLHDAGPDGTPGAGPFSTFIDQTTKTVEVGSHTKAQGGVYQDIVDGLSLLAADGKRLTGFALDSVFEPILLSQTDTNGRPLFVDTPLDQTTAAMFSDTTAVQPATPGRLIGRSSYIGLGVANNAQTIVGYGGDWSKCAWGAVGGIDYRVSTEATVTINGALVSLYENNLVAILGEAYFGFLVGDTASFVQYKNAIPTASA